MTRNILLLAIPVLLSECSMPPVPLPIAGALASVVDTGPSKIDLAMVNAPTSTEISEQREEVTVVMVQAEALAFFLEDKKALSNGEIDAAWKLPSLDVYKADPRCHAPGPHGTHTLELINAMAKQVTDVDTGLEEDYPTSPTEDAVEEEALATEDAVTKIQ